MKWTNEKPTVPGWYWVQIDKSLPPIIVAVDKHEDGAHNCKMFALFVDSLKMEDVDDMPCQWSGPIQPPEE